MANIKEGYAFEYINENEYRKLERAIRKYNMLAFKKLTLEIYPELRDGNFIGEVVSRNTELKTTKFKTTLPVDKMFKSVHGDITVHYTVYHNERIVLFETITPTDILGEGHRKELTTYKGVMISEENRKKDVFKVDLLNMLKNGK